MLQAYDGIWRTMLFGARFYLAHDVASPPVLTMDPCTSLLIGPDTGTCDNIAMLWTTLFHLVNYTIALGGPEARTCGYESGGGSGDYKLPLSKVLHIAKSESF